MKTINKFTGKYSFLSNFYPSTMIINNKQWSTVEHYFQAMKTLITDEREKIREVPTPGQAKRMGRTVLLRKDWEDVKEKVMLEAVREKFKDETLRGWLLSTKDTYIIEGNAWHDNIWGTCSCLSCYSVPKLNLLGKILMKVREEAKTNEEKA